MEIILVLVLMIYVILSVGTAVSFAVMIARYQPEDDSCEKSVS